MVEMLTLDKSYSIGGVIGAYLAVVSGNKPGECQLPEAYGQGKLLGVTVHSTSGGFVAIRKVGIARIIADGVVECGDALMVTPKGHVVAIDRWFQNNPYEKLTVGTVECLGFAETGSGSDGTVDVFISMHQRVI